ncbi:MAG: glycoside hydrolase family 25 [Lachnospiraceae bacterium]|nr:glycoside hydrolase family 25 [Lachnospiraceae bacterium]
MGKRRSRRHRGHRMLFLAFGSVLAAGMVLILALVFLFRGTGEDEQDTSVETVETVVSESLSSDGESDTEDEEEVLEMKVSTVKKVDSETEEQTRGIDVSEFQKNIDWAKVASADVDFVMVRCGYRTASSGVIKEDACARYNLQEAHANGLKLGAYFFSTAITEEEAREEARWMCDFLAGYPITYPVVYDCEGFQNTSSRQYGMTTEARSVLAEVFLDEIEANGYTGMFYAARNELTEDTLWKTSELEWKYRIWVAQYPAQLTAAPDYDGKYAMWQYTNQGEVPGIEGPVDWNIAYFGYSETASARQEGAAQKVEANPEVGVTFEEVNEPVTAKDVTNLRSSMNQETESNLVAKLKNGETVVRIGKGNNGWSRVEYNGRTLYAVSNYLTTDLSYQTPVEKPGDGFKQSFMIVSENVTAKEVTNLRTRPSMEDSEIRAQLSNGQVISRTGVSDMGWSRVEYNGETLYCISSYLQVVE